MAHDLDPHHLLRGQSAAERIRVRNITNPTLWLCAIVTPLFLVAAYLFRDDHSLRNLFAAISIVPLALAVFAYLYWSFREPDRLQSEEYQLQRQEMQFEQLRAGVAVIDPNTARLTANPRRLPLPSERGPDQ